MRRTKNCERCGTEFVPWHMTKAKYCSRSCQARRPIAKATRYRMVFYDGRYVGEHRAIMERSIGRRLTRRETVHHINGDKLDNRLANLELLDRADHARHHRMEQLAQGIRLGRKRKAS